MGHEVIKSFTEYQHAVTGPYAGSSRRSMSKALLHLGYIIILDFMLCIRTEGAELRHTIPSNASDLSVQTQNLCHGLESTSRRILCLPTREFVNERNGLDFSIYAKADSESF
ncbi:MAG: hypothetical protein HQK54_14130, partial [Oligoflexales bacterium]|nr:hypothetical protein [Oligoflexales bacterium]